MYVADRDTRDDAFCGICGEITDRTDLEKNNGCCEYCETLKSICEAVISVARREVAGDIDSDTAQEQIKALIETAAKAL